MATLETGGGALDESCGERKRGEGQKVKRETHGEGKHAGTKVKNGGGTHRCGRRWKDGCMDSSYLYVLPCLQVRRDALRWSYMKQTTTMAYRATAASTWWHISSLWCSLWDPADIDATLHSSRW